jgi:putative ABC transport system ATP-binding protein
MPWWRKREEQPGGEAAVADPTLPVIRLEHVTKIFKGDGDQTRALDDITLDIERGEYVAVSGPSGCGKSTFLSVLALLDTPSSGRYWLNGRATDRLSPSEKARVRNLDVGLIFQSFNLIGDMTIYENVEYPLTLRGVAPADRKARVEAALDAWAWRLERNSVPGRCPAGNSSWSPSRGRSPGRPAILLADEPTGNLDSKSGEALMQMFGDCTPAARRSAW